MISETFTPTQNAFVDGRGDRISGFGTKVFDDPKPRRFVTIRRSDLRPWCAMPITLGPSPGSDISLGGPKRWWMLSSISESRSVTELVGSRIIGRTEQQPTRF